MVKVQRSRRAESQAVSRRRQDIIGLAFVFAGLAALLCLLFPQSGALPGPIDATLRLIAGVGAYVIPALLCYAGAMFLLGFERLSFSHSTLGSLLLFGDFVAWRHLGMIVDHPQWTQADLQQNASAAGGWTGWALGTLLHSLLGSPISYLLLFTLLLVAVTLLVDQPLIEIARRIKAHSVAGAQTARTLTTSRKNATSSRPSDTKALTKAAALSDAASAAGKAALASEAGTVRGKRAALLETDEDDRATRAARVVERALVPAANSRTPVPASHDREIESAGDESETQALGRGWNLFSLTRPWRGKEETSPPTPPLKRSLRLPGEGSAMARSDPSRENSDGLETGTSPNASPASSEASGIAGGDGTSDTSNRGPGGEGTSSPLPFSGRGRGLGSPLPFRVAGEVRSTDTSSGAGGEASHPEDDKPAPILPPFVLPPLTLLNEAPAATSKRSQTELTDNVSTIERTLEQFNIGANVVEVASGPSVTRYEIQLAPGIKVSKIVSLADNLAMSLAAIDVRVEAPIPGKAAIGVEVPNATPTMVSLRECLDTDEFRNATSPLTVALGKDVSGHFRYADLTKMPHLLIGGSTNSGKSVCLNVLIASLVYRGTPRDVRLLMIDPKRVELSLWDGIPHLMHPVVKDVKQAAGIFRAALKEMDRRYDLFATLGTRNLEGFNGRVPESEKLPYIVLIVDELADLMIQQGPEVETSICRLAQLARATGIHLVIATQRPSVDIITGTIKANISSRIAFAVASQVDSRTILDMPGADRLIGRGDMLFMPIDAAKPQRIQGCYLSEAETNKLVEYLKEQEKPDFTFSVAGNEGGGGGSGSGAAKSGGDSEEIDDQFFEQAVRLVVNNGQASTSMLQRRFRIGYTRAARIVELMEERGIVGPLNGAKPREILVSKMEMERLFNPGGPLPGIDDYEDEEGS